MQQSQLKQLISIEDGEKIEFKKLIRRLRAKHVTAPKDTVEDIFATHDSLIQKVSVKHNISETINYLRQQAYDKFLLEEAHFNILVLKTISEELATPQAILDAMINQQLDLSLPTQTILNNIKSICGEYAGRISPFIYELSLSNTQSRRSRAGKTFEAIIYKMYEIFGYGFASQQSIGRKAFAEQNLGKIVDSLLPSIEAFKQRRDKVVIGTMKTTLRERWQEVIEELNRTNLPSIYLLTVDDNISVSKAMQMSHHNVIIVVPKQVKAQQKLQVMRNIISFEDYFLHEIPEKLGYWQDN